MYYDENDTHSNISAEVSGAMDDRSRSFAHGAYDPSEWYGEYLGAYYQEVKEHPKRYAGLLSDADKLVRSLRRQCPRQSD